MLNKNTYEDIKYRSFDILSRYLITTDRVILLNSTRYQQIKTKFPIKNSHYIELWSMGWECIDFSTYRFNLDSNKTTDGYLIIENRPANKKRCLVC